jgi:hypothetical protein
LPYTVPSNAHLIGDSGHTSDHNNTIDVLRGIGAIYNVLNTTWSGGADPTGVADSTSAFAACLAAAISAGGAEMIIPPGTYNLNTGGLNITGPVLIRGTGVASTSGGSLVPTVVLNCNGGAGGTGSLFNFPYQGYLWTGLEMCGIAINYTGTGDVFHLPNLIGGYWHDMQITLTTAASYAWRTTGTVSILNCEWERVFVTTTNATRSSPMISLSSATSGSISNNTFWKCTFSNNGLDNTQYMIYIDCAGGSGAYHYMETFRDCWWEHPYGGAVKSMSGMAVTIDCCTVWDIFSGSGNTVGNSTYYIGAYPSTGPGSLQTRIMGCSRNRNGPNGSTTWDVYCEASTAGTIVESYSIKPDTPSTATHAYFNFNAHPDVQVIGCTAPQGAAVNGNSTTVITNPGWSCMTLGAGASASVLDVVQAPFWTPLDSGSLAWNFDPALLVGAGTPLGTTGQTNLCRINVRRGITVTNVVVFLNSNGSGLTASQSFVGLFDSTGALIGSSADQSTNWGAGAPKLVTAALVGGPYPLAAGFYWVGILSNWTVTAPGFGRAQNFNATIANFGVGTAATARFATRSGTGTSLASFTPSASTVSGAAFWVALT